MVQESIAVFDFCITKDSPAGSCVLQMLTGLCKDYQFIVFADRFDNPAPDLIQWVRVALPKKPVISRFILFQFLAPLAYKRYLKHSKIPALVIGTQGEFINCNVSYSHFCHKSYLQQQWKLDSSRGLRRFVRLLNHQFGAVMEAQAFQRTRAIVVPSQGLASDLQETYSHLIQGKVYQIPNPVNIKDFHCPPNFQLALIRQDAGFAINDLVMVFVALGDFGRKGLDLVLEGMSSLKSSRLKLIVVGGTKSEIGEYELRRDALGLKPSITFVGFQKDVRPYLWTSDVFVFPSAYEVFPLAVLKAAAAGLPIISTSVHGVREFLQNGVNGWVVERSAQSLSEVLRQIEQEPQQLVKKGANAQSLVAQYDTPSFIESWKFVIQSLLQPTEAFTLEDMNPVRKSELEGGQIVG
jgi:glycosyltransferase involved in cell wall biosynthesis